MSTGFNFFLKLVKTPLESSVESPANKRMSAEVPTSISINVDINADNPALDNQQRPSSRPFISSNPSRLNDNEVSLGTRIVHTVSSLTTALNDKSNRSSSNSPSKHIQHPTWWEYVRWTSSSKATRDVVGKDEDEMQDSAEKMTEEAMGPYIETMTCNEFAPNGKDISDCNREDVMKNVVLHERSNQQSIATSTSEHHLSQDGIQVSVWYTPWSWYPSSTNNETTVEDGKSQVPAEEAGVGTNSRESIGELAGNSTEADITPASTQPTNQSNTMTQSTTQNPNPIATLFEVNTMNWASILGKRMLTMKRVGNDKRSEDRERDVNRDENGVEVMNIDDDDETSSQRDIYSESNAIGGVENNTHGYTATSWSPVRSINKPDTAKKPTAPSLIISDDVKMGTERLPTKLFSTVSTPKKGSPATTPTPPSPPSSPSQKNSTSSATETIKNAVVTSNTKTLTLASTTNRRVESPTPLKKSVAPSQPDLVLPKWQNIFLSPPRNVLPPKTHFYSEDQGAGRSLLGKTMNFMSRVIYDKDTGSSDPKGKGRAREGSSLGSEYRHISPSNEEWTEKFGEFGNDLPKAWKIVEESGGQTTDILRGCRKVVVIGVHGWFPNAMIRTVFGEVGCYCEEV